MTTEEFFKNIDMVEQNRLYRIILPWFSQKDSMEYNMLQKDDLKGAQTVAISSLFKDSFVNKNGETIDFQYRIYIVNNKAFKVTKKMEKSFNIGEDVLREYESPNYGKMHVYQLIYIDIESKF